MEKVLKDNENRVCFKYLSPAQAQYEGKVADTIDYVTDRQLTDKTLWKKFANQFRIRLDGDDLAWRGEYWGKMMRGGCLTYMYSGDEKLYDSLSYAVEELLETQDELGRISTYHVKTEFSGWDLWCRKYAFTGLQHFYKICKDEQMKVRIVCAMKKAADYICERIGEGKIDIRTTSYIWGNVNSCSILEPFIELYNITQEKKYLDFGKYIIDGGGCLDGDLLLSAMKEGCKPYQYPATKAYEIMSFFEGVLAYYEVTKEEKYRNVVKKFVEDVYETERTVVGGISGKHELFDNFYLHQTETQETVVQETCVTVTWIRLLTRLYFTTGDVKYADWIERSVYNALWGSLNTEWNKHYSSVVKRMVAPLPFDSYSPLVSDKRGKEVGGFTIMEDGSNYGCCVCIGAAGIALMPLFALFRDTNGFVFNFLFDGTVCTTTPSGHVVKFKISGGYPTSKTIKIQVECETEERFSLRFRKPCWSSETTLKGVGFVEQDGYLVVDKEWKGKETLVLNFSFHVKEEKLNGKTALTYGPLVLALDEGKGNENIDGELCFDAVGEIVEPQRGEQFRYRVKQKNGEYLVFSDYASCGKSWENSENRVSVWLSKYTL